MILTPEQYKAIKRMSYVQLSGYLARFYREAYTAGLRDAEQEYDDPEKYQIITEDEARATLGDEKYEELVHDHKPDI